jgi:hypothetical protein
MKYETILEGKRPSVGRFLINFEDLPLNAKEQFIAYINKEYKNHFVELPSIDFKKVYGKDVDINNIDEWLSQVDKLNIRYMLADFDRLIGSTSHDEVFKYFKNPTSTGSVLYKKFIEVVNQVERDTRKKYGSKVIVYSEKFNSRGLTQIKQINFVVETSDSPLLNDLWFQAYLRLLKNNVIEIEWIKFNYAARHNKEGAQIEKTEYCRIDTLGVFLTERINETFQD